MSKESGREEKLFAEFPPVSEIEWKDQVAKDLKGKEFEKLIWKTYGNLKINPFYTEEDLKPLQYQLDSLPTEFPFIRGTNSKNNDWQINQEILAKSIKEANILAVNSITGGTDSLTFNCSIDADGYSGIPVQNKDDILNLLVGINIKGIQIHFKCARAATPLLSLYINEANKRGISIETLHGSVDCDPLGELSLNGTFSKGEQNSFNELRDLISYLDSNMPNFKCLKLHSSNFHNSGASITQELAFTLAQGVEYLDQLTEMDLSVDQVSRMMSFSFSVGSNYFMEIAKLRAARALWAQIIDQYQTKDASSKMMSIEVTNSSWNKTMYDPFVNMLRGTVETMAAAIGGAGTITVRPLDAEYETPDEFSVRMARNTQLMLKHESYLERIVDPSAGSYYIENLTNSIAKEAWRQFLEIESLGGFLVALKSGFIQSGVDETRQSRDINIATRKDTVLGVNQYPDLKETISDKLKTKRVPISPESSGNKISTENKLSIRYATEYLRSDDVYVGDLLLENNGGEDIEITPLTPYRGAQKFEELRLLTEKHTKETKQRPKVFLLTIGNPSMRTARASISANFFGCAGFEIINNIGFDSPQQGVKAALENNASIVVICSSDDEYPEFAPEVCSLLKKDKKEINVIVAGNPKEHIKMLEDAGVDDFIHIRSNALEILKKYQEILGIRDQVGGAKL